MSHSNSNREPSPSNLIERHRTADPDEPQALQDVVKDTEVWLPDGNIVIISKNIAFRVHRSILTLHSKVFRDLFLLSLPAAGGDPWWQPMFEGCPAVRMSDNAEDLRHLLLVIFCGKDYYHEDDEIVPVPCEVLCSLIRMGHRFAIAKVLSDAISRLKKYYTSDLTTWGNAERRAKYVNVGATDHLLAIQVAYLTNTPSILPTAFLEMCPHVESHIVTLSTCDAECQCGLTAGRVVQATSGKAALTANVTTRLLAIHTAVPASQCPTQERCAMVAQKLLRADVRSGIFGYLCTCDAAFQPLYTRYWGQFEDQLCPLCRDESRAADEQLRKSAWKNLPHLFGLQVDDWPV